VRTQNELTLQVALPAMLSTCCSHAHFRESEVAQKEQNSAAEVVC
jgi:protein involved in sex pheromone biosynthesis